VDIAKLLNGDQAVKFGALREKFTTRRYVVFFAQAQSLYLLTKTRQYELFFLLLAYIYAIYQPANINNTSEDNSHRIRNKPSIRALAIKLRKAGSNCSFYKTTN